MNIGYKIKYTNKKNEYIIVNVQDIEEAKQLYKTLLLDSESKDVKFYITNQTEIEMQYDELFEKNKIEG
nr:MAG TPA: hypothetical protein [Caudoviricetes sp.]